MDGKQTVVWRPTRAQVMRKTAAAAAGVAGAALLQACGAGAGGSGSGTEASPSKQPVKLVLEWPTFTQPKQEWAEWAMKAYSQKFPHVTLEPMWNTNAAEKLRVSIAAGAPPDVGWLGVGFHSLWQALKPVEPFLNARKVRLADYFPTMVEAMKWRGKLYAFPMGINTTAMFVNTGMYQKAGLPLPTDELTWEDMLATGRRLTSGDGAAKVWANNAQHYTVHWIGAYGGAWLDPDGTKVLVNNPASLKVMTYMREFWDRHGISPSPAEHAEIGSPAQAPFVNQRIALFAGGTWGIDPARKESFDWDLVEPPTLVEGGKKVKGAFAGTEEIALLAGQPNEEAAADFALWLCGPEHLTWAGNKGHIIPALQKTAKEAFVNPQGESRPKNIQAFVRAANYAPPIIPHPQYTELNNAFTASVRKWLGTGSSPANTLTAEQALREAQTEMQRILDDWNKANPK